MSTKVSSSKSYSRKNDSVSTKPYSGSKIESPSDTPEKELKTIGGMPPIKKIDQINQETTPKKAPGAVHGL